MTSWSAGTCSYWKDSSATYRHNLEFLQNSAQKYVDHVVLPPDCESQGEHGDHQEEVEQTEHCADDVQLALHRVVGGDNLQI